MTPALLFREMTPADIPAGLRLSKAAHWNQREADWRMLLELAAGLFRAAEWDGQVVGTGGAACYGQDLGWICMILVERDHRGRGIATRLMEQVLDGLGGFASVGLDATPAGRPVYARLGFSDAWPLARFAREAASSPAPEPSRARPLTDVELPAVLRWDRETFGADRSSVLRWAFAQAPEYSWRIGEGDDLGGYCFGRHGQHSEHIGPVVARRLEDARALVAAAASAARGRVIVDAPTTGAAWVEALAAMGLAVERPFTRMYRGAAPVLAPPDQVFAVFGPEFG